MLRFCLIGILVVGAPAVGGTICASDDSTSITSGTAGGPDLVEVAYLGVSTAVRALPPMDPGARPKRTLFDVESESDRKGVAVDERGLRYGTQAIKIDDPLAGRSLPDGEPVAPDLLLSFEGLSSIIAGPPDPEGAVGPNHYVQFVNIRFRVFDKMGVPLTDPIATNAIWAGSGGVCESDLFADAVVLYDRVADRWVVSHIAAMTGQPLVMCVAVSSSADPTGEYYLYELETARVPDYPKVGTWPDPVHNAFVVATLPGEPGTHDVYALDRERMLAGAVPRPAQRFTGFANLLMPADLDGSRRAPTGSPVPLYTFRDGGESYFRPPTPVDSLDLFELTVDWDHPGSSRIAPVQSFVPPELAEFNWTVCGWNVPDCLDQPGTSQMLDSISWIPMQRFQYRNLGAYETLVGVWTVNTAAEGKHAAPRWFELRRYPGEAWELAHQGTFAPNSLHRWMASVAIDGSGNMAMGFSVMSAHFGVYPSLCYTVRKVDVPDFVGERTLAAGTGSQTGLNRWGDYASMEVDPTDDCTFWFTGEYMATTGPSSWSTRIGAFRVPGCTGTLTGAIAVE